MKSFDLISGSMKTVMSKTKYVIDSLQKVDIDLSYAVHLMKMTKSTLSKLRTDATLLADIAAAHQLCEKLGIDPGEEYARVHRKRKVPQAI